MSDAWFSASDTTTSPGLASAATAPTLAAYPEENSSAASTLSHAAISPSAIRWASWVPLTRRDAPAPLAVPTSEGKASPASGSSLEHRTSIRVEAGAAGGVRSKPARSISESSSWRWRRAFTPPGVGSRAWKASESMGAGMPSPVSGRAAQQDPRQVRALQLSACCRSLRWTRATRPGAGAASTRCRYGGNASRARPAIADAGVRSCSKKSCASAIAASNMAWGVTARPAGTTVASYPIDDRSEPLELLVARGRHHAVGLTSYPQLHCASRHGPRTLP